MRKAIKKPIKLWIVLFRKAEVNVYGSLTKRVETSSGMIAGLCKKGHFYTTPKWKDGTARLNCQRTMFISLLLLQSPSSIYKWPKEKRQPLQPSIG